MLILIVFLLSMVGKTGVYPQSKRAGEVNYPVYHQRPQSLCSCGCP
jgi:hypothetical protein